MATKKSDALKTGDKKTKAKKTTVVKKVAVKAAKSSVKSKAAKTSVVKKIKTSKPAVKKKSVAKKVEKVELPKAPARRAGLLKRPGFIMSRSESFNVVEPVEKPVETPVEEVVKKPEIVKEIKKTVETPSEEIKAVKGEPKTAEPVEIPETSKKEEPAVKKAEKTGETKEPAQKTETFFQPPKKTVRAHAHKKMKGSKAHNKAEPVSAAPVLKEEPEIKPEISDEKNKLPQIEISAQITVRELAEKMSLKTVEVIKKLMQMGVFASINQILDSDVAELVAAEYGYDLNIIPIYKGDEIEDEDAKDENPEDLRPRPPIVTIMGHVDHGKTTLLDALRESDIVASESGAITQHIGAYMVKTPKGLISFLDTPGHEAFTAMRAHGVKVTDIVILVVSATDGVKPQTVEAINHAKAAGVPLIVAINKIDLPTANPQGIIQKLSEHDVLGEDWGGKTIMVEISAKKRLNLDKLLDMVLLQSEMMELKGNPNRSGKAVVIEAKLDQKRGNVATIIDIAGTIKVGDPFVMGTAYGKIRALRSDTDEQLSSISPSLPAEILGITGHLPQAGDVLRVMKTEKEARRIAEKRKLVKKEESFIHQKHVSLLSLKSQVEQHLLKTLNIILKTDVYGSLQAIKDSLERLGTKEVTIHILHSGVGNIVESDLLLAKASNAIIMGFHVNADSQVLEQAAVSGIEIRTYKVIYELLEDVTASMSGLLEPEIVEVTTGKAEVRQIFDLSSGKVAGSIVKEGKIKRNQEMRLLRAENIIWNGKISGLKRFKEDVKEVDKGIECGILMEGCRDFQIGDIIEAINKEERIRRLTHE